jgi:hypothetical protein
VNVVNERRSASVVRTPIPTLMDAAIAGSPSPMVAASLRWSRSDGPQSKRRRDTCGGSNPKNAVGMIGWDAGAAAIELIGVHHNTVRYRLDQTEIGYPPGEHRLRLELALHLAEHLGAPTHTPQHRS